VLMGGTLTLCARPKIGPNSALHRRSHLYGDGNSTDECGETCKAVQNLFFEPASAVTTETWAYVGDGNGGYRKVRTYRAEPGGAFDMEGSPADPASSSCPSRLRWICCPLAIISVVALMVTAFLKHDDLERLLRKAEKGGLLTSSSSSSNSPGERLYDCAVTGASVLSSWTTAHRSYCCQEEKVLCRNECDTDGEDVTHAWSPTKLAWCCEEHQVGCSPKPDTSKQTVPQPETSRDCKTECTYDNQTVTCKDRIAWSARNRFHGELAACAKAVVEVVKVCDVCAVCTLDKDECLSFDCEADLENFAHKWPSDKKSYCCSREGKGCADSTGVGNEPHAPAAMRGTASAVELPGPVPFQCHNGLASQAWGWSDTKKEWCCRHQNLACPSLTLK
jgi:hypothetical protein